MKVIKVEGRINEETFAPELKVELVLKVDSLMDARVSLTKEEFEKTTGKLFVESMDEYFNKEGKQEVMKAFGQPC